MPAARTNDPFILIKSSMSPVPIAINNSQEPACKNIFSYVLLIFSYVLLILSNTVWNVQNKYHRGLLTPETHSYSDYRIKKPACTITTHCLLLFAIEAGDLPASAIFKNAPQDYRGGSHLTSDVFLRRIHRIRTIT